LLTILGVGGDLPEIVKLGAGQNISTYSIAIINELEETSLSVVEGRH